MTDNKKIKLSRTVFTGTTVLLLAFIFGNSAVKGGDSGNLSLLVTQWLNGILDWLHIPFDISHHAVRKLAHFTEYSLLGGSLTAAVWSWSRDPWRMRRVLLPILFGAVTASLDELLQTIVPDRYGCVSDALLDLGGVLWAALAVSAVITVVLRGKECGDISA